MSRPKGSENFNKLLLANELREKKFDLVHRAIEIINDPSTPVEIASRMLMQMFEYVFPKRRPEDSGGEPGESPGIFIATDEQLAKLVGVAKGEK